MSKSRDLYSGAAMARLGCILLLLSLVLVTGCKDDPDRLNSDMRIMKNAMATSIQTSKGGKDGDDDDDDDGLGAVAAAP
jgi:hypothetical protein